MRQKSERKAMELKFFVRFFAFTHVLCFFFTIFATLNHQ